MIETRVLGLNHFLQMVLSSPHYSASEDLIEFLENEKNMPPPVPSADVPRAACAASPRPLYPHIMSPSGHMRQGVSVYVPDVRRQPCPAVPATPAAAAA